MKKVCLYLKADQIERLAEIRKKTGAPVAELIRRAIDEYIKSKEKL